MMYSDIVGEAYYHIKLTEKQKARVDIFFYTASHHRWRMKAAAINENWDDYRFHRDRYYSHLEKLMETISQGNFTKAIDKTRRGLERPSGWDYQKRFGSIDLDDAVLADDCLPDPDMFDAMTPDYRFEQGEEHGYDAYLTQEAPMVYLNAANA